MRRSDHSMEAPPSVLVVDDNPANVQLLALYLEQEGYRVASACSGAEALELVAAAPPDLIFLDVMMPGMDGFTVCSRLKSAADTQLIPVVMVTALSAPDDRVRGIEAGADDFLSKPVNRHEFLARTRSLLRVKRYVDELESAERVILSLSKAVEARDGYTEQHAERVTEHAIALGRRIGLAEAALHVLYQGGMLHDIGKIGIPEGILGKPGKLTNEEYGVMRRHPAIGEDICRPLRSRSVAQALPLIRHHHERVDGHGYPDGLLGEEIPLPARIMAISDAYDAMISDRPYRQAMRSGRALHILREGAGMQWDAVLVEEFVDLETDHHRGFPTVRLNDQLTTVPRPMTQSNTAARQLAQSDNSECVARCGWRWVRHAFRSARVTVNPHALADAKFLLGSARTQA